MTYPYWNNQSYDLINQTFAHEGRMPPLVEDNRSTPSSDVASGYYAAPNTPTRATSAMTTRRWSACGGSGIPGPPSTARPRARGNPGTRRVLPGGAAVPPPIYPSYPPPYPAPLRGIQIQIRVADPTNQRVKTLTIRQDFTDKL